MAAQRRAGGGAVWHYFVTAIEQALVPKLLEDPPDAFNVFIRECHIGVVNVHPECDALGELFPFDDVAKNRGPAHFVEFCDAVFFDLALVVEAELLFDRDFHRQTVRVPSAPPQTIKSIHHLVAREHILESPRQDVMACRLAVRRWRSLIKHVSRSIFAPFGGALKYAVEAPEIQLLLFEFVDALAIDLRVYCPKHDDFSLHDSDTNRRLAKNRTISPLFASLWQ